jgi:hypothetical protein
LVFYITNTPIQETFMFRIQSPSPMAFVERRLTPRRGDGGAVNARIHRERDFGVGYGSSSGYASNRTYTSPQASYFRCR